MCYEYREKFIHVDDINTMQVIPSKNCYFVGIDTMDSKRDICLVFTIDQIRELADYLATNPNPDK